MFLLLDECCPKSLVTVAKAAGHTVQRSIEVGALGRSAPDAAIFAWVRRERAILVTVNAGDFVALAGRGLAHPGVLLIPSVSIARLQPLFLALLEYAGKLFEEEANLFLEIEASGRITSFTLPDP